MSLSPGARRLVWSVVGLCLLLLAVQPLLTGHLPWRGDGSLHFYRLVELERAVRHGDLPPVWAPDLGYGYGFPLFRYYAPLSYLLLVPLRWLGLSTGAAYQVGYGLALGLIGLGLAGWSRAALRSETALALAAPVAAVYAPYVLYNVYHRGAFAEVWGLAWLSLSLWAIHRAAAAGDRRAIAAAAVCSAALALSHNVLALLGVPLLATYALIESHPAPIPSARARRLTGPILALLLGLGLAAFFWLPALAEQDAIRLERLVDGANFNFRAHFLGWRDLLALPRTADPAQVNPALPLSLGWPQLMAAALAWWPTRRALPAVWRRARLTFTLGAISLIALMFPLAEPVWAALAPLAFVQFPWRLLGPVTLCLAALTGVTAIRFGRRAVPVLALGMMLGSLTWLFPARAPAPPDPSPVDLIRFEAETGFVGTTSAADFLPRDVAVLPPPDSLLPAYQATRDGLIPRVVPDSLPGATSLVGPTEGWNVTTATVDSTESFTIRFRRYAFPGWELTLDGRAWPWRPAGPTGLIEADVPAGRHELRLVFAPTPADRWARALSLAALLAVIALGATGAARSHTREEDVSTVPPVGREGLALLALGLTLLLAKGLWLDRADTPFRRARLVGDVVQGVGEPVRANFDDDLELLAAALPSAPVPVDQVAAITLGWRALPPVAEELSVSLQLEDALGRRFGQSDRQHPADMPVTRWLPGEYALDEHTMTFPPGTPPGPYTLWLQVYETATGELTSVRDAAGRPAGARLAVGTITLARPTAPPPAEIMPMADRLDADLGDHIRLLGHGPLPERVSVGEPLGISLFWQATAAPARAREARLRLLDGAGWPVAETRHVPPRPDLPPLAWRAGDLFRDDVIWRVPVLADSPPADAVPGPLAAGRYTVRLALVDGQGALVGPELELGQVEITAPARTFSLAEVEQSLEVAFGGVAALRGYDLAPREAAPGETVTLVLYWESLAVTEASFTVFVQMLRDGDILAQQDSPPLGGGRPTTGWYPGEFLADPYRLVIPLGAEPADYGVIVGLYDAGSGSRLTTASGDDAATLPDTVKVRPAVGAP